MALFRSQKPTWNMRSVSGPQETCRAISKLARGTDTSSIARLTITGSMSARIRSTTSRVTDLAIVALCHDWRNGERAPSVAYSLNHPHRHGVADGPRCSDAASSRRLFNDGGEWYRLDTTPAVSPVGQRYRDADTTPVPVLAPRRAFLVGEPHGPTDSLPRWTGSPYRRERDDRVRHPGPDGQLADRRHEPVPGVLPEGQDRSDRGSPEAQGQGEEAGLTMEKPSVRADRFDELAALIEPIVLDHPELTRWWAQADGNQWLATPEMTRPGDIYVAPKAPAPTQRPTRAPRLVVKSRTYRATPQVAAALATYDGSLDITQPTWTETENDRLRRRVAALERRVDELALLVEDRHRGADREYHEFMDDIGWTERMERLT